eukprot:1312040-Pyramimonas_sp.AAC.1
MKKHPFRQPKPGRPMQVDLLEEDFDNVYKRSLAWCGTSAPRGRYALIKPLHPLTIQSSPNICG